MTLKFLPSKERRTSSTSYFSQSGSKTSMYELVMDLALPLHLILIAELLGEPALHLPKAHVVHLRGVGVAAGDPASEVACDFHPDHARLVGVVRVVDRDVNLFVHVIRSPSSGIAEEISFFTRLSRSRNVPS